MELGITSFAETPPTGPNAIEHGQRLRNVITEGEQAEAVGLDVYGLGEHHRPDMAASTPAMTLAAAAARTERIRLSSAVIVLSSADPVRTTACFIPASLMSSSPRLSTDLARPRRWNFFRVPTGSNSPIRLS